MKIAVSARQIAGVVLNQLTAAMEPAIQVKIVILAQQIAEVALQPHLIAGIKPAVLTKIAASATQTVQAVILLLQETQDQVTLQQE